jgi:hypothetical protein
LGVTPIDHDALDEEFAVLTAGLAFGKELDIVL